MAGKQSNETLWTVLLVGALIAIAVHQCGKPVSDAELERTDHAYEQGR